jgi:RNA polymerase sigma-70 factor (ECF subfamily)
MAENLPPREPGTTDPSPRGESAFGSPPLLERTLDLLDRAREGDAEALESLCARYLPRLRRWATGRLPEEARRLIDTEDLVQDVLLGTVRRIETFVPQPGTAYAGFHAYLRQAILNRIRDSIRSIRRTPPLHGEDALEFTADSGPGPLDRALGRETAERYEQAMASLKADDREAVIMRLELGLSYEEIGEVLGKPSRNAARMFVIRALERLTRLMDPTGSPQ